jgi:hypothetical protein
MRKKDMILRDKRIKKFPIEINNNVLQNKTERPFSNENIFEAMNIT